MGSNRMLPKNGTSRVSTGKSAVAGKCQFQSNIEQDSSQHKPSQKEPRHSPEDAWAPKGKQLSILIHARLQPHGQNVI